MIYLDNAATTRLLPEVLDKMMPFLTLEYANPSALYGFGADARKAVNATRRLLAESLGAKMEEIYFTSGGTESDNWAILGAARANAAKGRHIVTTQIEHHAVLHTLKALEKEGFEVTYLPVDGRGFVEPAKVENAIRRDTILVSVMAANNELGTIEPVGEIGRLARAHQVLFHTDAVQAFGQIPLRAEEMGIDLLSASAHKFHGPKGAGFLYVRSGVKLSPILHGGGQEGGLRAGTEHVAGIVGLGEAARLALESMEENSRIKRERKAFLQEQLFTRIPNCRVNSPEENCLPGILHVSFAGVEGEALLVLLDMKGICASSGSACASGDTKPSHVLTAAGLSEKEAKGSLRLSLSEETTTEELGQAAAAVEEAVHKLRSAGAGYM